MTRGGRLLSGKVATWMDKVKSGYSAATAPLRFALSKIKLQSQAFERVAQVSLLRPGFLLRNRSYRNTSSEGAQGSAVVAE